MEDPVTDLMRELWGIEYPGEPFEIDYEDCNVDEVIDGELAVADAPTFSYDLAAAVKRQSSFYYQVSRPTMQDQRFLEAAVARYKGFLHLIRRNKEISVNHFAVPTYDIDLIWHSHQLHPLSYCNDLMKLLGMVLVHNDMDSYRNEGKKLDVGFTMTTRLWEEMFGSRYLRAGAMYRGSIPSPVINSPLKCTSDVPNVQSSYQRHLQLQQTKFIEVFLEVLDVKNIPDSKKGTMFVSFSKNNPDPFLIGDSCLSIRSETGKRNIGSFQCDPTGDLILTLLSKTMSFKSDCKLEEAIGTITISLQDIMQGNSELAIEKWFELKPKSENDSPNPMFLHVAVSCTPPAPAPFVFYLTKWPRISRNSFSPSIGNEQQLKHSSFFIDSNGSEVIKIFMRILKNRGTEGSSSLKQVVGLIGDSGKSRVLAEFNGNAWSFTDFKLVLTFDKNVREEGNVFELQGDYKMKLFPGKRLEFEARSTKKDSCDFITVVQFSVNEPYGKALALINVKTGLLKVNEEWFMLPGLVLTYILWSTLKSNVPSLHLSHEEDPVLEHMIPCTTYLNMAVDEDNSEDYNVLCWICLGNATAEC